jgi:hypothetical protein
MAGADAAAVFRVLGLRNAVVALLALAPGCTCGSRSSSPTEAPPPVTSTSGTASSTSPASSSSASGADGSMFSAPIAGARSASGDVLAGLVARSGVVRVMGVAAGQITWTSDALKDVAWTPDAELVLQPAHGGLVLVWRGMHAGKSGRTLVLLGPSGEARDAPIDIGPGFCVTDAGVAWLEPHASGPARVMARAWTETAARQVGAVATDRDPALVCGDHDVTVLGDGDDDLTMASLTPGDPSTRAPAVAIRDADFGDDEEREHDAYTFGDDLGLVRVASSGAVAMREVPRGGSASAWRRLKHTIPADDDVVAVDGDAETTLIVYTQDADDACPGVGSTAEAVHAIRVVRKTGEETLLDLAPADCQRSPGPFWIAPTPLGQAVGWIERTARPSGSTAAPIAGASFRLLTPGGMQSRRIEQAADALVDAGCDAKGCSLAALVRPAEADGMQPESLRAVAYP